MQKIFRNLQKLLKKRGGFLRFSEKEVIDEKVTFTVQNTVFCISLLAIFPLPVHWTTAEMYRNISILHVHRKGTLNAFLLYSVLLYSGHQSMCDHVWPILSVTALLVLDLDSS